MNSEKEWMRMRGKRPEEVVQWALGTFGREIGIASSFSMEDVAVIHMAAQILPNIRVFAIDTGRLNEETYECADAVRRRYALTIEWVFPRCEAVETLERNRGLFSFRESIDARHECCGLRKVEPLSRAVQGLKAWMTGMRREHGVTRATLEPVQADPLHEGVIKVNPLADWSFDQLKAYTEANALPVNRLYDRGYSSIGCAPCTRAVAPGDEIRAGRWWWERPDHKECGLHGR